MGGALGSGAGQFGVMIFFLLSAFLISHIYLDTPPTPRSVTNFAIARIARVIPLFLTTVLVSFAIKRYLPSSVGAFAFDIPDVNALLSSLLLLHGVSVLWSIPPEIHFYILFAIAWILWPYLQKVLYGIVAILLAGSIFLIKGEIPTTTLFGLTVSFHLATVFPYFAIGFMLGHFFRYWQPPSRISSNYFVIALFVIPLLYPAIFSYLTGRQHGMWADLKILICVSAVFFVVVFLVPEKNWVLENWAGDILGKISYSLYLLHLPLLLLLKSFGLAAGIGGLALFLLFSVALACISFYAFEQPMRKLIRSASLST